MAPVSTGSARALERPTGSLPNSVRRRIVREVLMVIALYSFAGWIYIALNAVVHPESLVWPLTHLLPWPHEDTFGIGCFVTSFGTAMSGRILRART
jgi:hypothetical protein